jgi:hypothetical protein
MRALFSTAVLVVALASIATAIAQPPSGPPMPYEDPGVCPFEGCVYRNWQALKMVKVHRTRSSKAPLVFTVANGERVTAITGVVVTHSPGQVRFRRPVDLRSTPEPVHVDPGETLYLLTYHGEGDTAAWFKGRLYPHLDGAVDIFNAACDDDSTQCAGRIVHKPRRVWWVQLKNSRGQMGWASIDQSDFVGSYSGDDAVK